MLSFKRAEYILSRFEFDCATLGRFRLTDEGDYIRVRYSELVEDVDAKDAKVSSYLKRISVGVKNRFKKSDLTANDFLVILKECILTMALHEALEHMRYNGEKVFCPHKRGCFYQLELKKAS